MSFQDWLLLNDWCLCIPGLILCAVSVGPELCLQPSHLRNYGFDRLKVLWEYSMEGQRWEIVFTFIYFNEKLNEMLPSCRVLFLSFCQGSLCKWGLSWGRAQALQASCSCRSASLGVLPIFLTSSPISVCPICIFILIHITSDMFYENTNI